MILIGIHIDHFSRQGTVVIIDKCMKNVRHHYTVQEIVKFPAADCPHELGKLYRDSRCITRKRIFSQDRRPKKDVSAHPLVIATVIENDRSLIEAVRRSDVPVEALFITGHDDAARPSEVSSVKPGLGLDLTVSEDMLRLAVMAVRREQRLVIEAATPEATGLSSELEQIMACSEGQHRGNDNRPCHLLPALAAPLWYRENVRYRQVYRTSATCVRQFK